MIDKHLKKLQKNLNGMSYFIINKKSMVGHHMLALVNMWLCQAFLKYQNQVFGDRLIILISDFSQLPLVLDKSIYFQIFWLDLLLTDSISAYE